MNLSFWEFFKIKTKNGKQQNNPAVWGLETACLCKFNRQFWEIHFPTLSFQRALQHCCNTGLEVGFFSSGTFTESPQNNSSFYCSAKMWCDEYY